MRMTEEEFRKFAEKRGLVVQTQPKSDFPKKKQPKYRNKKMYLYACGVVVPQKDDRLGDIIAVYDSQKEYSRHEELRLLEKAGVIKGLKRQEPLVIQDGCVVRGEKLSPIVYVADFCYQENGVDVVEDVKGLDFKTGKHIKTKDFSLKWKLLKHKYPEKEFRLY